jgi:hypothetical protein
MGSPAGHSTAELGGGPGMMGGSSSLLGHATDDLAGPDGGPGMMSGDLPALGGAAHELGGPGGGHGMMAGHLGAISEHDSVAQSGYEASANISSGASSVNASSFLGGSFVHPHAPLHLNLPMGGGAGDTSSTVGPSNDFRIPTAAQPADAPQEGTLSESDAPIR